MTIDVDMQSVLSLTTNIGDENNTIFNPDEFDAIVRSILVTRAKDGASIQELRDDYYNLIGEVFPIEENITEYLLSIPNVTCQVNSNGCRIFNLSSTEKSNHIIEMVKLQKSPRYNRRLQTNNTNYYNNNNSNSTRYGSGQLYNNNINRYSYPNNNQQRYNQQMYRPNNNYEMRNNVNNNYIRSQYNQTRWRNDINNNFEMELNSNHNYDPRYENKCYFEDNYKYLNRFTGSTDTLFSRPTNNTSFTSYQDSEILRNCYNPFQSNQYSVHQQEFNEIARIHDYQLLGDDFFLAMAKMELQCKIKKGNLRDQSGLCISGLTIKEATFRVLNENKIHKNIVVNIGSVDILQEHHLIDIQQDFIFLLRAFESRGIRPILTTLAPMGNLAHRPELKRNLEGFNEFIKRCALPVVDIWSVMATEQGATIYNFYQSGARSVTGSSLPHVFWNKIGRQRILNKIKAELPFV